MKGINLMKSLIKIVLLSVLLSSVYGCVSSGKQHEIRLKPPETFNTYYLGYTKLQGPKVCVIAVDASGEWAFGYSAGTTLEDAAQKAAVSCDQQRDKLKVFTKAKLFAVNDEIVYYK